MDRVHFFKVYTIFSDVILNVMFDVKMGKYKKNKTKKTTNNIVKRENHPNLTFHSKGSTFCMFYNIVPGDFFCQCIYVPYILPIC